MKRLCCCVLAMVLMLGLGTFAYANSSPDGDFVTDSSNILVTGPDTSIASVDKLMLGDSPAEVLKDASLEGYSTLAIFSVIAIDGYDFTEPENTRIMGAAITADMELQVRFLPDGGSWQRIDYEVEDGILEISFASEGQLAIFAKDDIDIVDDSTEDVANTDKNEGTKDTAGKSPQTGDRFMLYICVGAAALAVAGFSYRRMKR